MKKSIILSSLSFAALALFPIVSNAQSICMVSADYDNAENFIVVWEKPLDITGIDSVYIYRKQGNESLFSKVGASSMQDDLSFFLDESSNTIINTYYRISFLDDLGNESAQSNWHRPVVLDYVDGNLIWTPYEKENQVDETWIAGYACMRDETGMGFYSTMGYWETVAGSTTTSWFDQEAASNANFTYQMGIDLPSCAITRANINTSRSNIKRQFANSEAGISDKTEVSSVLIAPNPVSDVMHIQFDQKFVGDEYLIVDAAGKTISSGTVKQASMDMDMSPNAKGTYFLHLTHLDKIHTKVFMKN